MQKRFTWVLTGVMALAVSLVNPALAGPPPAGWTASDIGFPEAPGTTDVTDGVWTVNGGGHDIWDAEDDFHYAYQRVTGDASISARFLNMEPVNPQWSKAGLMVRENDTPGSPYGSILQNSNMGARPQARIEADTDDSIQPGGSTANSTGAGPAPVPTELYMRVQRSGTLISYYLSDDGTNWRAFGRPHTIPTLGDEALYGMAVTSHERNDLLAVARFDNVQIRQGATLVPGLQGCGGDKMVRLEWSELKGAEGFNIYRAAAGETDPAKFVRLAEKATGTSFTDTTEGLVNNTPVTYAVAAVVNGAEAERTLLPAVPFVPTPVPGFTVTSLNENPDSANPDNVHPCPSGNLGPVFDATTGVITHRGSGGNIGGAASSGNYMLMALEGNVQVTVKALTKPLRTNYNTRGGLSIREGLERGDREVFLGLGANSGLWLLLRDETDLGAYEPVGRVLTLDEIAEPMWLRLTRNGDDITAEYSLDDGKTFEFAGDASIPDLAATVYVGLGICSDRAGTVTEATYSNLTVTKQ